MYTHDLILQSIYDGIAPAERILLHYEIGVHLGKVASSSSRCLSPIDVDSSDVRNYHPNDPTFLTGSQIYSPLLALACDQMILAKEYITDDCERIVFAQWNLTSGERMMSSCDFPAALYYFEGGISFLPEDGSNWEKDRKLSVALYRGAVSAAFSLSTYGDCDKLTPYKDMIEKHISFDECLDVHIFVLQAMLFTADYEEGFKKCLQILEHFDFRSSFEAITDASVFNIGEVPYWRRSTDELASQLEIEDVVKLCGKYRNERTRDITKIVDIFTDFAWGKGSLLCKIVF